MAGNRTTHGSALDACIGVINEVFFAYDVMPFELQLDEFVEYAMNQFQKRIDRLDKSTRTNTRTNLTNGLL
jgi:hypothetical protein